MEALRDMALAEFENSDYDYKTELQGCFDEMVADGTDFSEFFENYRSRKPKFPDSCEIHKKKILSFEEFITAMYMYDHSEALIVCDGCSSWITGKPYFICNDCFKDIFSDRNFHLCCDCYRTKNFKDHEHTSFYSNYLSLLSSRFGGPRQELMLKQRNEFIDNALVEFSKEFAEFAKSVATNPIRFEGFVRFEEKKSDEISVENSTISQPQQSRYRCEDPLGMKATFSEDKSFEDKEKTTLSFDD